MIPKYNKVHLKFKLNDVHYSYEDLMDVAYCYVKEGLPYQKVIGNFLLDWLDAKDYVITYTSGTTGVPKKIKIKKQFMVNSAIATGNFFNLKPGSKALYCLPSDYVAGKMMLIRAMVLGLELDLTPPTSQPIFDYEKAYDFAAIVPMQLEKIYSYCQNIKTIIVGGSPVSKALKIAVNSIKSNVYETYGMTETVTHVAVKKLNNFEANNASLDEVKQSAYFKTLPNVSISQDDRGCLVIDAPQHANEKVITNDIVRLHSNEEFEWLGRCDNVINSGAVKLYPEKIEAKLQSKIEQRFFIASEKNEVLGEQVILVVESDNKNLDTDIFLGLEKFEKPKSIYFIDKFIETTYGKIIRKETLKQLKRKFNKK